MWQLVKHVVSSEAVFLYKRCLDQIVLCSMYAISKIANLPLKFQDIVKKYQETVGPTQLAQQVVYEVVVFEGKVSDIITFYNEMFIPNFKHYLVNISSSHQTPCKF